MKVLLTTHQFFPSFGAGTEVLTYSVAKELIKRGFEVRIFSGHPLVGGGITEEVFSEYDFEGIRVYRFLSRSAPAGASSSLIARRYDNPLCVSFFSKLVENFKPDFIHFFHLDGLGAGLIEESVARSIPSFFTPTDFWSVCPMGQLLLSDGGLCEGPTAYSGNCLKHFAQYASSGVLGRGTKWLSDGMADNIVNFVDRFGRGLPKSAEVGALARRINFNITRLNMLNGILAPGVFMESLLLRYGVKSELIRVGGFGVDVVAPLVERNRRSSRNPLVVGYIGTLAQHKGCHVLLEATRLLPRGSVTLKIYGNADDYPEYFERLKKISSGKVQVQFCGTFKNTLISNVLAEVDVLVVPSLWYENTPLVLYSALGARCPVIVSDLPGLTEVVKDKITGLVFKAGDSDDLRDKLVRIISEEGLLDRLSDNILPPRSTGEYVDDVMSLWNGFVAQIALPASV
jgi:glycosyltransferase involved in cell wall biosynthesis